MRRRNKNVSVRMTEDEYAVLTMRVAESGQTLQSFIINAVLEAKVSGREEVKKLQKLNGQFADISRQLRGMATNINQMAHVQMVTDRYHNSHNWSSCTKSYRCSERSVMPLGD